MHPKPTNLVMLRGGEDAPVLPRVHPLHEPRAARLERLHLLRRQEVLHGEQAVSLELRGWEEWEKRRENGNL